MVFKKSQSVLEYFIISAAVLVAFIAVNIVPRIRDISFRDHFEKCKNKILT